MCCTISTSRRLFVFSLQSSDACSYVQVAGQYLEFLVSQERFEEAAALMPRLLKVIFLA